MVRRLPVAHPVAAARRAVRPPHDRRQLGRDLAARGGRHGRFGRRWQQRQQWQQDYVVNPEGAAADGSRRQAVAGVEWQPVVPPGPEVGRDPADDQRDDERRGALGQVISL